MDTMPRGGLVAYIDQHALDPTPYIDYYSQCFSLPKPVHARQLHSRRHIPEAWDMRSNDNDKPRQDGLLQVRTNIVKSKDAPRETGNDAATSDQWRITAHDVLGITHGKRVISPALRISDWIDYIKSIRAKPVPGTCCLEFGLDFMEQFTQDDHTRAYLLAVLMFHLKHARGLGGIKAVKARRKRTKSIQTFHHAIKALMDGYQLMIGDRDLVQFKSYIKRTDSINGQSHVPLPLHLHRARIEVRATGQDCPITGPAQLTNLVPLASWFALLTAKDEDKAGIPHGLHGLAPTRKEPPEGRKTLADYRCSRDWYDRLKGRFRRKNLGDKKINSKRPSTEGKRGAAHHPALITSEAASSFPPSPKGASIGHAEGISFSSASLSVPEAVQARHGHESSLQQLGHASPLTFDKRPAGQHIKNRIEHRKPIGNSKPLTQHN